MATEPEVIKHIIEKGHDDWKYSITISIGSPADKRELKARGDNLDEVLADIKRMKTEVV